MATLRNFSKNCPKSAPPDLRDSYGLITIAPELWKLRTKVLLELLQHKNPHTGLRYCDDPALATVEMQNEDSVFFWNPLGELTNPATKKWPNHARKLRQLFAAWAKQKYGTDDALEGRLGRARGRGNRWLRGRTACHGPWELDMDGPRGGFAGKTGRAGDYVRFLTELQHGLYADCEKAIRDTGFRGQTVTTNWLSGSPAADLANIFTDTVGSLIDRHNYAGGGAGGHGIGEGAIYADSHRQTGSVSLRNRAETGGKQAVLAQRVDNVSAEPVEGRMRAVDGLLRHGIEGGRFLSLRAIRHTHRRRLATRSQLRD